MRSARRPASARGVRHAGLAAGLWLAATAISPSPLDAQDPVRVSAALTASSIEVGETTVLDLTIRTDGERPESIDLPSLPAGLNVLGTRDFSQLQFSFPGGRTRVVRREVTLTAHRPGRFQIAPIRVAVDGVTYRTRSLSLNVTAGAGAGAGASGAAPQRQDDDDVLLRARVVPDTVYVGQQVTLEVDALFSDDARDRLRSSPEYEPPDATGFWVRDLPEPAPTARIVDGRAYEVRGFRRVYFPLQPGNYTLPPARLTYEIRRGFLYTPARRELESDSLRLVVRPVPDSGRPASFTGAVGRYSIDARLEPRDVPAGEAAVLVVEVEGTGNVRALPAPALPGVDGVRFYPPGEEADIRVDDGSVAGRKRFSWVLVPEREGRLRIPPIAYAFFDPDAAEYRVARTEPLLLRVRPGASGAAAEDDAAPEIRYLKLEPAGGPRTGWVRSAGFAAVQLLPLVALGLLLVRERRRSTRRPPSRRALRRRRRRALADLRSRARTRDRAFFRDLEAVVRRELADRLHAPDLRSAAPAELAAAVRGLGVDDDTARRIPRLLSRLDRAGYEPRPPGAEARLVYVQAAERVLDAVDRAVPRPSRLRQATAAGLLLLTLAGGAAPAPAAQGAPGGGVPERPAADGDELFREGAAAYAAGDHGRAARAFTAFLRDHPNDPHGWYNLGNTYHRQNRRGDAVWAWLRALRLHPRDADVRHNLTVAEASPALIGRATGPVPLTPDELLLAAGIAWLLGAGAFVLYLTRSHRRALGAASAAGVVVAVLLAGAWTLGRLGAPTGVVLGAEAVPLRAAPNLRAAPIRQLPAGAGVEVVERQDEWLRVTTLERGDEGWVGVDGVGTL